MADLSGRMISGAMTSRMRITMISGMKTIQRIMRMKKAITRKGKRRMDDMVSIAMGDGWVGRALRLS